MFCGRGSEFGPMNREHFVPRALWASSRPEKTRTLPAHISCNRSFSADNEYFRDVLAMEEGAQKHPEVQRLQAGTLKRKLETRFGSVKQTLVDLRLRPVMTKSGIYLGHAPSFKCDWQRLERVLKNVMRGVYYTVQGKPLPQRNEFLINVPTDQQFLSEICQNMVPWQSFGDTVFMCRYGFNSELPGAMAVLMVFYEFRVFLGITRPPETQPVAN